ncbi:hypothetical protein [Streptomyces sp. UNOC14_S4]|uniref:hypothetical protein n=1 Tax=Streptomyces sp. UNOC14_S4 TaxID=2872340 RepID=UPI001E3762F0|nr:hypothetical protein [Streptomyces sp. UNOC14_S4]MCC3771596.1 hypothetical protein [Streptomyces sp. UNOC14_S4]
MRRAFIVPAALAAFVAAALTPPVAQASPAARAVPPGQVYFWPEQGQMGPGGAWAYTPPGYREADARVKRHAFSFDSHARVSVYSISHRSGGCLYREIRPDDYDNNWTAWATKFDGVSDTTMGCERG